MTTPAQTRPLLQKVAAITGASRGIGRAIAQTFAAAGCDLALSARNTKFLPAAELADPHGVRVLVSECDVRNQESVTAFFNAVSQRFGRIDILVNNAGLVSPSASAAEISYDDWRDVIDTNLTGTFLCCRAALPLMRRGGVIVNNVSISAQRGFPGMSSYDAAKAGALGFTRTLREELRERGIRVVALLPGATDTDIWNQFWPDAPRERMMSPETVARAVLHAVTLPENAAIEELVLAPASGRL